MSLNKAINKGAEHRKPYYGSGKFDRTCRPGGSCPYCRDSRQHKHNKKKITLDEEEKELRG